MKLTDQEVINLFNYLVDTLLRLTNYTDDDSIDENLEELEGDYYTFFHSKNLDILLKNKMISNEVVNLILDIRQKIEKLDNPTNWNINSFKTYPEWIKVRENAKLALEKIYYTE